MTQNAAVTNLKNNIIQQDKKPKLTIVQLIEKSAEELKKAVPNCNSTVYCSNYSRKYPPR